MPRRLPLVALGLLTAAATAAGVAPGAPATGADLAAARHARALAAGARPARDCPPGTLPGAGDHATDTPAGCSAPRPEGADLSTANASLQARHTVLPGGPGRAYAAGVAQAAALAATPAAAAGTWTPVGTTPERFDVAGYTSTNDSGLRDAAGRIQSFAVDPASPRRWFAAVANGGVWRTDDAGGAWTSVGDTLPTQIVGAVDVLPGGVMLAGTGDPAFGGSSTAGLGLYRSTDGGRSWIRGAGGPDGRGVPDGSLTFRITHDPDRPGDVWAATSKGLWSSTDGGVSWANDALPTTCTDLTDPLCFFANIVTDVVVRGADATGAHTSATNPQGYRVLAAVGWRAGQKPNAAGRPQSPRNGLYLSTTGAPGSFAFRDNPTTPGTSGVGLATGFAGNDVVGRTALAVAHGRTQSHDIVYAVVQDAGKFTKQALNGDLPEPTVGAVPNSTVLNGLYASKDFGQTWTKVTDADQLKVGSGTALTGSQAATYSPGVQAWYNEWVDVDPTAALADGTPLRIAFGLEEVWEGPGSVSPAPAVGPGGVNTYHVIGRYFSGTSCAGLRVGALTGLSQVTCPGDASVSNPGGGVTPQADTTHPDQHAGVFIPDAAGPGLTLLAGNDGGAYTQHLTDAVGGDFSNDGWGRGVQNGMHTLLAYSAALSADGTAVEGLQDNGSAVIRPDGTQIAAYGGDGFYVAIDPADSATWYEEYTGGAIRVTRDGGKTWSSITPCLTDAQFSTPFVMDRTNAKHLIIGGRQVAETLLGPDTTSPVLLGTAGSGTQCQVNGSASDWQNVFDLGTVHNPGAPGCTDSVSGNQVCQPGQIPSSATDPANSLSAVDVRGDAAYVGFCGYCDVVAGTPFHSGLATNVAGSKPPRAGTPDGWHIARAAGLPQRYISSVTVDPADPRTVYATLAGYGRRWIPPGALGDDTSQVGSGHVFVSHDAGESFTDVSGNLPDLPANWVLVRQGQLLVGTDLGTFVSNDTQPGASWAQLGSGLPKAPVFQLQFTPRAGQDELIAASYGRGVYLLRLPAGPLDVGVPARALPTAPTGPAATPPAQPGASAHSALAPTGLPTGLGVAAVGLVVTAAALRRRSRAG